MKTFLTVTAAALALVTLSATGCSKASASSNRLATLRAKAVSAPVVIENPAPEAAAASIPAPVVIEEAAPVVPVKRVKNPNVPGWEQLVPDMTKKEVEEFVGRPNAKNELKWVYKNGASVRFTDKGLLASYDAPRK